MYRVIILHGSKGTPFENWIPWLAKKLIDDGITVLAPQFPTYEAQNYNTWCEVLNTYKDYFDRQNTIFISHSVSSAFAVKYLTQTQKHVKALVSVAGFTKLRDNLMTEPYKKVIGTFVDNLHTEHFEKYAENRYQFYSNNDDYIDEDELVKFGNSINAQNIYLENQGHFNEKSGNLQFEELYQLVKTLVVKK